MTFIPSHLKYWHLLGIAQTVADCGGELVKVRRLERNLPHPRGQPLVFVGADHRDLVASPRQLLPGLHHADLDTPEYIQNEKNKIVCVCVSYLELIGSQTK